VSAYTEKNFNACLDSINEIRSQRDEGIRIARSLSIILENSDYHDQMCDCGRCKLGERLDVLISRVIAYQKGVQEKK
jgi:hypothetical protein